MYRTHSPLRLHRPVGIVTRGAGLLGYHHGVILAVAGEPTSIPLNPYGQGMSSRAIAKHSHFKTSTVKGAQTKRVRAYRLHSSTLL